MNKYVKLAKTAVETYLKEGKSLSKKEKMPAEFKKRAGVFVTILDKKKLRGCVGTFLPTKDSLFEEIVGNAIMAATRDFRFEPITKKELPRLSYEVSILEKPEQIKNIKDLDAKIYGVIIRGMNSGRSALLLPDLDGLDTVEKQLAACCAKAGINPDQEEIAIHRFKTKKYI